MRAGVRLAAVMSFLATTALQADFLADTNVSFGSSPATVRISIKDVGNSLQVDLTLLTTPGDLRGFFFNVVNPLLLQDLQITGTDVTGVLFSAGAVTDLGLGANIHPAGPFDAGVALGTPGAGGNLIQQTSFLISSTGILSGIANLGLLEIFKPTIGDNFGLTFGVRVTSLAGGGRAKIGYAGQAPEPTSLATWVSLSIAVAVGIRRRRRCSG